MADILNPTSEIDVTEQPLTQEETTNLPAENATEAEGIFAEEIEEELIIEDFTIDGICGVY